MTVHRITLDTTIPYEVLKPKENGDHLRCVEELTRLAKEKEIELFVTRRIRDDIPREPLKSKLDALLNELCILETGSVARLDHC